MPKGPCTTVYVTDRFELYTDKNGKFWLWNKVLESNHAIRAESELEAYREAMDSAIYAQQMHMSHRYEAEAKLSGLESAFKEAFPQYVEED